MAVISGTDLHIFLDDVAIANSLSYTLTMTMKTRPTSNKDTGTFDTEDVGRMDVSASCEGHMAYAGGYQQLWNAMRLRTPVTLSFGEKGSGVETLDEAKWFAEGEFIVTSCELRAGDTENASFSASFKHESGFTFTAATSLTVFGNYVEPLLHDGVTGVAAVTKIAGGISPYTYLWTFGAGGQVAIATDPIAYGMKGTAEGIIYTCTVTDSTPVTPLTGTYVFTMHSPAA